uniref:Family with sequence similarity 122B n=1 Tax=Nothobranchius pienaari TaxID=704102 RepID=A0A1A8NYW1_9TELE
MERMEVDQCAGAAGGALRRSNSAPMITGVSDGTTIFSSVSSTRFRRSSVSINPSQLIPSSPFPLSGSNPKRPEEKMETTLRGSQQRLSPTCLVPVLGSQWHDHATSWSPSQDSGVTPNSSPSPTRRFRPTVSTTVRWSALRPLKRKGGVDSDGPPKKLFVAGVTDPAHRSSSTLSVSQPSTDCCPVGRANPPLRPLSVSPPHSFTPFTSPQNPGH